MARLIGGSLLIVVAVCFLVQTTQGGFSGGQTRFRQRPRQQIIQTSHLTETCMGCICEATSNCTIDIGCTRGFCGPFFISNKYWTQSGMPVLNGDHPYRAGAYQDCVNDPYCAARAVRGYMDRYAQDCNQDGYVNCEDYGRIHYMGGHQCGLSIKSYKYYKVFQNCLESVSQLSG